MRIAIFGATGRTGRHLVEKALQAGHDVVAFVRDPQRARWQHERLSLVQGDAREREKVQQAVKGVDAVLSALHPAGNTPERAVTQATANIVRAMEEEGVERIVASCGAGVSFPQDQPRLLNRVIGWMVRTFARNVYEDMKGAAEQITTSSLKWTLVRVPVLTEEPAKGHVNVDYVGSGTGPRLSREDMAAFMLEQVERDDHLHDVPVISN